MNIRRSFNTLLTVFVFFAIGINTLQAESLSSEHLAPPPVTGNNPIITPTPPTLNAKAYILIDVDSGKIIGGRLRRARPGTFGDEPLVEFFAAHFNAVFVHLVTKPHIQRHHRNT